MFINIKQQSIGRTNKKNKMSFIIVSLILALLIISLAAIEAKPLNQNQVKFRRLPPKEFSAAIGSSITIECEAGASPPPQIYWLKNGKRILQSETDEQNQLEESQILVISDEINRIALSSTRSRLFIDCANVEDQATYTCVAENAFSRISSHTKLDLLANPLEEVVSGLELSGSSSAVEAAAAAAAEAAASSADKQQTLSAVPQCLRERGLRRANTVEPARIHMWTHNIVEIMKNDVLLYCRSNAQRRQQQDEQQTTIQDLNKQQKQLTTISWTLPDDKLVNGEQKDKYEILESGDLLIKDLRWSDMGSYVCTVSNEQTSDSISTFVYPAAVKLNTAKRGS